MPPLVAIVGETASGKSALAMQLAEQFDGELICADSWTVYKGFDIGTAKPSAKEQAKVPHHLVDVADPVGGFSAPQFQKLAIAAIAEITARGKLPILVGGTGLYIDSVLYNYGFLEKSDPAIRAGLNAMELADLLNRAKQLGLDTTSVDTRNKRRVIRLIENDGAEPTKERLRPHTAVIGITTDREHLHERMAERVDAMLSAGLELEVTALARKYGWDCEAMKGIGYWQWQGYVAGSQTVGETRVKIIKATIDLAKRQRTWFKRNSNIQWVNNSSEAVEIVTTLLNKIN